MSAESSIAPKKVAQLWQPKSWLGLSVGRWRNLKGGIKVCSCGSTYFDIDNAAKRLKI